jgi:hypothetical protein
MLRFSHITKRINRIKDKYAHRTKLLLFVLVFALAGVLTLVLTWASGPRASVEPEQGAVSLPATVGTDSAASGGGYVKFGTPSSCPTPAPTTAAAYEQLIRGGIGGKKYTADDGQSARLPNGKVLWVFGDTFVRPEAQPNGGVFINNNFILTDKGCAQAVSGPNDAQGQPTSTVKPTGAFDKPGVTDYYWPNIPFMDGNTMYMFMGHMYNDASGFHMIGQDLAQFDVSGPVPVLTGLHQTPGSVSDGETAPAWGSSVLRTSDFTYIYGTVEKHEAWVWGKYYYVARVPNGQVANPAAWQYWGGASWVTNQATAAVIIPGTVGVGSTATVYQRTDGSYVLVSKKFDIIGGDIVAWTASSPAGPWTESSVLLTIPNVDTAAGEHTYFGLAHPEVPLASGKMLVSWSLNSSDPGFFGSPRYGLYFGEAVQP